MPSLVALFILLPALELYLLIAIGTEIGALATFALILVTGAAGASLVRSQGLGVLRRIQAEAAEGRLPAQPLLEGLVLLLAGALLVTPGLLTDLVGFLALVPPLRARAGRAIADRVVVGGSSFVVGGFPPGAAPSNGRQTADRGAEPRRSGPEDGVVDVDARGVD